MKSNFEQPRPTVTPGARITEMFAFTAIGTDNVEGIVGWLFAEIGEWMPLVGADLLKVEQLKPFAIRAGHAAGVTVKLCKFSTMEVLEEFKP